MTYIFDCSNNLALGNKQRNANEPETPRAIITSPGSRSKVKGGQIGRPLVICTRYLVVISTSLKQALEWKREQNCLLPVKSRYPSSHLYEILISHQYCIETGARVETRTKLFIPPVKSVNFYFLRDRAILL